MWRDPALRPLSHQHQHGLALTVIINRTLQNDASEPSAQNLAAKVASAWEIEIAGHFQVEERELFPEVQDAIAEPQLVEDLILEHRRIEQLVGDLRDAPSPALLQEFAEALSTHIRREERELFQQIQEALNEQRIAELGQRIDDSVQKVCPVTERLPWE